MPEHSLSSYNNSKSSVIETELTTTTKDEGLEIQRTILTMENDHSRK
jgi:hypothetical protein